MSDETNKKPRYLTSGWLCVGIAFLLKNPCRLHCMVKKTTHEIIATEIEKTNKTKHVETLATGSFCNVEYRMTKESSFLFTFSFSYFYFI